MVLYARNGMGKTHFATHSRYRTLVVDFNEKGIEAASDTANVDVLELDDYNDLDPLYWHLRHAKHPYELIVWDTITMASNVCIKWIMGVEHDRDNSVDPTMPDKRTYGKLGINMGEEILKWRNLPYHMIFLAQERRFVEEGEGENGSDLIEIGPSLTPAVGSVLRGAVGTIGRLYTRQVTVKKGGKNVEVTQRRMLVGPHELFSAKTRIKGLPRIIINPTLDKIMDVREKHGEHEEGQVTHGEDFE